MTHPYFAEQLIAYAAENGPVTIGLIGAGQMGKDLAVQVALMSGIRIGGISVTRAENALGALHLAGHSDEDIIVANNANAIDVAIEGGKIAICEGFEALTAAGRVDVIIDATGNPNTGSLIALSAIKNGKHMVMLNVEADITIGRYLAEEAKKAGVIYTGAAGDEPACVLELIGFARSLGMNVIAAGKGKNNPLNIHAVPAEYEEEARARDMNARMLVEFVDGSKTAIEMVAIANCTGLIPDIPGMHGPKASLDELANVLCPVEDGGILSRKGVVDYSIGKGVAPGVFCIVETKHPRVLERMADLKVGKGPYFTLTRPFHLTSLEVPLSAARAVMHGEPDMVPIDRPVADAVAVAKRDLQPGEILGRIGQADYRGYAVSWQDGRKGGYVPIGLAEKAVVSKPVKAGDIITYANCVPDKDLIITQIRHKLDQADAHFAS
ncbi:MULTISPECIES: NAD(P)H-dependent oxidoreductase [unclassified Lentilitoribacter]|jgi:predicted homoserine dehydrogenase-like protein|uniref:NAD(P)H-dependent oxidoreductase n=1 Tax=unclassified Lentilitoribacter TaxID=2647570 RepID=UPI0013A68E0A|nr:SAF domain-containing protein [Lentilitoribacter sp. Alg239-R112]